jgi:cytidine deaminase
MPERQEQRSSLDYPELFFGLAGPIGVDMDLIAACLQTACSNVGYSSSLIKLTTEMTRFPIAEPHKPESVTGNDTFAVYMRKMSEANALRKQYEDPAVLARIAIETVRNERARHTKNENVARAEHAYIVRQLKRPEEVELLRKVYGRQFALISAYAPEKLRKEQLCARLSGRCRPA